MSGEGGIEALSIYKTLLLMNLAYTIVSCELCKEDVYIQMWMKLTYTYACMCVYMYVQPNREL